MWDDVKSIPETVMTVNDMVMYWPGPVNYAYSHDDKQLVHWNQGRRNSYIQRYGYAGSLHTIEPCRSSDVTVWPYPAMGTSALGACYVALSMGFDEVVLAGCPLDDTGHFYDPPYMRSNFTREAMDEIWLKASEIFQGRVTSLSGRSKELLSSA